MTNQELPKSILDALEKGPFSSLSKVEQEGVLKHISKAEFNDMHGTISEFQSMDRLIEENIESTAPSAFASASTITLSWWKAAAAIVLIGLSSFFLGRATVSNDCIDDDSNLVFAYQDTIGRSLAEDTIRRSLWCLFDKEML